MEDIIVGIIAILIGAIFCFRGYFAMRIVIPIWGAFAGFMLGAGAVDAFDDSEFLTTVLGWVLGIFIGLLFAVIAYLYYEVAVVLAFGSIGFFLGAALMTAINIDWNWVIVLVGIAVGILFAIMAVVAELPMILLIVVTTISGALSITSGLMLLFGAIETEDWNSDAVIDRIDDDWWWWLLAFALAVIGMVSQMRAIADFRTSMRAAWNSTPDRVAADLRRLTFSVRSSCRERVITAAVTPTAAAR